MRLAVAVLLLSSVAVRAEEPKLVVKPDAFPTLVNPNCSHCIDEAKRRKDELKDNDRVLCWTRGKYDGGAIPFRFFLNPYRVISDTYGVFVHDPDAGYARGFKASVDFRFHGWRNGVMVMKHKDGTLYSCLTGLAFDGPRKGEKLESWPTLVSDWGWYLKNYPGGVAYHMFEKYQPVELPDKPNEDALKSRGPVDQRLKPEEMVLGVVDFPQAGFLVPPQAYRLDELAARGKFAAIHDKKVVVLWQGTTRTAAAYAHEAQKRQPATQLSVEGEVVESTPVKIRADAKSETAPFVDEKTGSRFDVAGRCTEGELKGWTLKVYDAVMVKWFAWAAEYPSTTIYQPKKEDPKPAPKEEPKAKADKAIKEVAGTAEFLRSIPKHFATLKAVDSAKHQVTLLIEGEKVAKVWPLTPDAEVKVMGWWGRLDQLTAGQRVWVWFHADRKKQPLAVFMLCDEITEQDIHGRPAIVKAVDPGTLSLAVGKLPVRVLKSEGAKYFSEIAPPQPTPLAQLKPEDRVYLQSAGDKAVLILNEKMLEHYRMEQREELRKRWERDGLPGTVAFIHPYSGEVEVMLDHEAMRWGRSLKTGDKVTVVEKALTKSAAPPGTSEPAIKAVVKSVAAWRERTQVRLIINGLDVTALTTGQRIELKMPPPPLSVQNDVYPPDIDKTRTKEERIDWFLANVYCTCGVHGDICTGHFYTLASCNPNGCGHPKSTRAEIAAKIDAGLSNRQIFDHLKAERGAMMLKPHLLP